MITYFILQNYNILVCHVIDNYQFIVHFITSYLIPFLNRKNIQHMCALFRRNIFQLLSVVCSKPQELIKFILNTDNFKIETIIWEWAP